MKRINKSIITIVIAFLLISFSLFAPILFTRYSLYDLTNPVNVTIADTIYGLTGPFIAIAAALLTYAAFLVQKKANDIQISANNEQVEKNKIDSFENRLFKLVDTHRQNVNELLFEKKTPNNEIVELKGQKAIASLRFTLSILSYLVNNYTDIKNIFSPKDIQILSYLIFVHGNTLTTNTYFQNITEFKKYSEQTESIKKIIELISKINSSSLTKNDEATAYLLQLKINEKKDNRLLNVDNNKMNVLSRYFRQIYQIYSFIDKQDFLTFEQKYEYGKIFRTNLTNNEQELIYNNILSPYGNIWRTKDFIKKYKPFKNVSSFGMYGYSPADYIKDDYKIKQEDLGEYLDVLTFTNDMQI